MRQCVTALMLLLHTATALAIEEGDLRALPKVELHIHLSGAYPLDYLQSIATQEQYTALETEIARVQDGIPYAEFFKVFKPLSEIVDSDEKVEEGVIALGDWLVDQGVVYCELRTGLKDLGNGLEGHLQAVLRGMERAAAGKPFTWRLLLSVRRENSPEHIEETVDLLLKYADHKTVVGLDLSGNILVGDIWPVQQACDRVHQAGLPVTVHMGEVPGEGDQEPVLLGLKPQRIGHGVHLSEAALDYVTEHKTPLEVCLRSSEAAAMVEHHREHPGHDLRRAGIPISLSTDDPLFFATSPTYEQALYAECNDLSLEELEAFNRETFDQLFVTTHRMTCNEPWLSHLRSGSKTIEGRMASDKWKRIVPGDLIEFSYGSSYFYAEVVDVRFYRSVERYLFAEGLERTLPGVTSYEEGCAIYHQWHSPEEIARHGFLAIEVKTLGEQENY